jgi:hypothetical protein
MEQGRPSTPRHELWLYVGAAASYIGCGFFLKQIFAWWWFGAAWFVLFVWLVPKLALRRSTPSAPEVRFDSSVAAGE